MPTGTTARYTPTAVTYPLAGVLVCATSGCRRPLEPMLLTSGARAYRNLCGCRLWPVTATTVEARVAAAVTDRDPALMAGGPGDGCGAVFRALLAEVAVGGTVDDLTVVWRS